MIKRSLYGFETEALAASMRNVNHVKDYALVGADIIPPPNVIEYISKQVRVFCKQAIV